MKSLTITAIIVSIAFVAIGQMGKGVEPVGTERGEVIEAAYEAMR